jgi:hypothetical protein
MQHRPTWAPDEVDIERPSVARMYDYFLGGSHNFAVDRQAAEGVVRAYPEFPRLLMANRAFLRRAVTFLAEAGVDRFLDLGSGIPTVGNVHEIAQRINPAARVAYVDLDPIAVAHSELLLRGNAGATVVRADVRQPEAILGHPAVRRLLDGERPLAVLLVALLHFVVDDAEAHALVGRLRDALPSGSYMAISHASYDGMPREQSAQLERLYRQAANPVQPRSRAEIVRFFDGLELVAPGVVFFPLWHPEGPDDLFLDQPERCSGYAGVGRKP